MGDYSKQQPQRRCRWSVGLLVALACAAVACIAVAVGVGVWARENAQRQQEALRLAGSGRPNIISIMVDDQGWDDLRVHHLAMGVQNPYINTPNMDKFAARSLDLNNFYTTPMCSTTRASVLTGRDFPRSGALLINSGWDYINVNETMMSELLKAAGYYTMHFGKWHNGDTLGYASWDSGFEESWRPRDHIHLNATIYKNGQAIHTTGYMEERLMDFMLESLKKREASAGQPLFLYYATHAPHAGWLVFGQGPRYQIPSPPPIRAKYEGLPGVSNEVADYWAALEYIDAQIGRLLDYVQSTPQLADNTYIFLYGDNGPALFRGEFGGKQKLLRMPSRMAGGKGDVLEGGVRGLMLMNGPGVPTTATAAPAVTNAVLTVSDLLPTVVELTGIRKVASHMPWSGTSFAQMMRPNGTVPEEVQQRSTFHLKSSCFDGGFIPQLGPDRKTLKPQLLFDYYTGGLNGTGWGNCIAVRNGQYKFVDGQLYRFVNGSHIEGPKSLVRNQPALARRLQEEGREWWDSLVQDPHSFERAPMFIGHTGIVDSNVMPDVAVEVPVGRVELQALGVTGFSQPGDAINLRVQILRAGNYDVQLFYSSTQNATVRMSLGPYAQVMQAAGPSLTAELPVQPNINALPLKLGAVYLSETPPEQAWELRFEVATMPSPGSPVFTSLQYIRFKATDAEEGAIQMEFSSANVEGLDSSPSNR